MTEIAETIGVFDLEQLEDELSSLSVPGYICVYVYGDQATAVFSGEPSAQDEQAVRDAISSHSPNADREIRLYDLLPTGNHDLKEPPLDVDYITGVVGRLNPTNTIIVQGELRQIQYYATALTNEAGKVTGYEDLVIQEDYEYTRDPIGFAIQRTQTISWARKDGTLHPTTKQRVKLYEDFESLVEGQNRRKLLSDIMAMYLSGWLLATQTQLANPQDRLQLGRNFLRHHSESFKMFVDVSDSQIVYEVRDDAEPDHAWLDATWDGTQSVREWIDDQINIWNLP